MHVPLCLCAELPRLATRTTVVLVPHTADVTNVMFYNTDIFEANDIAPPSTWEELLAACDTLNEAGIIPIASGNKDLWAAGNWLSHMASRIVGEDVYSATLSGEGKFATPEWEQALGYIEDLVAHECVNESVNAVDDNQGAQLFFQGEAAMHPIGSWLVSWAIGENPDLNFDFVNLPAMPEGAGDQDSVIGVVTGHMVNANSENIDLAVEYLAMVNNEENVQRFIAAEFAPIAESATSMEMDDRTARLNDLLKSGAAVVAPPDTGYDLETALQLYEAEAAVHGGQSTPAEALATLDERIGRKYHPDRADGALAMSAPSVHPMHRQGKR